jgi:hypothetical protein
MDQVRALTPVAFLTGCNEVVEVIRTASGSRVDVIDVQHGVLLGALATVPAFESVAL